LAITWPKIMLRKMWSNQNGRQEPKPNIDKRRGSAQRIDRSRASLLDRACFFPSHHHQHGNWWWYYGCNTQQSNKIWSPTEHEHEQGWWGGGAQWIRVTPKIRPPKIK
jgi:hypothetical protein